MRHPLLGVAVGIALSSIATSAHHSISGVYDSAQPVTIDGIVDEFHFVNPHPFVIVVVRDRDGTHPWRLEMDNRWELAEVGVSSDTLKPGERVVVTGSRGRTQPHSLYIRRLDRPADGFWYEQVGSSPRTGSAR